MMVETLPLKYTKRMTMYLLVRVSTIQLHDMHACMQVSNKHLKPLHTNLAPTHAGG